MRYPGGGRKLWSTYLPTLPEIIHFAFRAHRENPDFRTLTQKVGLERNFRMRQSENSPKKDIGKVVRKIHSLGRA